MTIRYLDEGARTQAETWTKNIYKNYQIREEGESIILSIITYRRGGEGEGKFQVL